MKHNIIENPIECEIDFAVYCRWLEQLSAPMLVQELEERRLWRCCVTEDSVPRSLVRPNHRQVALSGFKQIRTSTSPSFHREPIILYLQAIMSNHKQPQYLHPTYRQP